MKYILIKPVKGSACKHKAVGEQVWMSVNPQPLNLNEAHKIAQQYNDSCADCGCRCKVKETE